MDQNIYSSSSDEHFVDANPSALCLTNEYAEDRIGERAKV